MPISVATGEQGEGLGGGEDLFVGESVEGELVPLFAREYGASGAPVLFGTEDNQLLSALFARKDDLLLWKMLHLYAPPKPLWASRCCGFSEPLGRAEGNFAHSQDGHKINDALLQSTYARRQVDQLLQLNIKLRYNPTLVSPTGMGAGLRAAFKILRVAELTVYTSSYEMAQCPQVRNGKNARRGVPVPGQ